jgi:hypothetical protein
MNENDVSNNMKFVLKISYFRADDEYETEHVQRRLMAALKLIVSVKQLQQIGLLAVCLNRLPNNRKL